MKKSLQICVVCLTSIIIFSQCDQENNNQATKQADSPTSSDFGGHGSQVKWGEHIVSYAGCSDCHSPKKMTAQGPVVDSSLLLSGHPAGMPDPDIDRKEIERKGLVVTSGLTAWVGPWGVSYSANLTPDTTGLGGWKEEQFMYAIREGKYRGVPDSRPLLPPMPWHEIRNMTDDELKAVFAYLQSIKPISNVVPAAKLPVLAAKR